MIVQYAVDIPATAVLGQPWTHWQYIPYLWPLPSPSLGRAVSSGDVAKYSSPRTLSHAASIQKFVGYQIGGLAIRFVRTIILMYRYPNKLHRILRFKVFI